MIWEPTHRIVFTRADGEISETLVMLCEDEGDGGGPAYTEDEWDAAAHADWSVTSGEWRCKGQVTPGGANGDVEVVPL